MLHVPMAWCVVNGSPAQAAPNITSEGSGAADTDTDAVIWRRHERPTDNIYLPQVTISLRSAINNAWGTFNFPLIADPDTTRGQPGDMNGWDVNADGAEFTAMVNGCDTAYANEGRAGIGITAVNAGLFHDNADPAADGDTQFGYVGVIGWGGCTEDATGNCATPYDGRIVVIDNHYKYPTVADRTRPPTDEDPAGNTQFTRTDPFDQLVGHETGHALGLEHRTNNLALMNPGQVDNAGDGRADNIGLDATEIATLRASAQNVPGLETDPPGVFVPGRATGMRLVDGPRSRRLRPYRDLAELRAAIDRKRFFHLGQQLWGLHPCTKRRVTRYAFLTDLDARTSTGAGPADLERRGIPGDFAGADLLGRIDVVATGRKRCSTRTRAWVVDEGAIVELGGKDLRPQIQTLRMHPHFDEIPTPRDFVAEVWHTIDLGVSQAALPIGLRLGRPFRAQGLVVGGGRVEDALGKEAGGGRFVLERPDFPHCFPAGDATAGGAVTVTFEGLRRSAAVHALLGPDEVARGETNSKGGGRISLPIPRTARPGLHLVTIGHDRQALTADCSVNVVQG
ncbi:MAG TPA: hypothetical protein VF520_13830 [Thermoleophilaceae bacterium]